ncbi:Hypothetical protein F387_01995 [Wohlfahrtiimonas chitiniclastica SH04]|uniref:Helix-turn-helix domain-containing protein n=1 Tax=Wohlfahrtiimonas chitiniclastica SH04 TaxID=1261130 RepID=L8XY30_9GAMM|nr:helix-turn-helix domain-containing protein [Wohlfahrtiimonas chitiniclastica]ELV07221.1 Hypothetical protein F387_01995 [Wohlfahrtiimonas chitiniclastica SH04]
MAIVSITEAAELTGKSRRTIQRHLSQGKLSRTKDATGATGVDISELIRVYGDINVAHNHSDNLASLSQPVIQEVTCDVTDNTRDKMEIKHLKEIIEMQKDHIQSLKQAMLLLEHKEEVKKENQSWFSRLFNIK